MTTGSDYDALAAAVADNSAALGVAACHGVLSGMLCVNPRVPMHDWLVEVLGDEQAQALDSRSQAMLAALFEQTRVDLESFEFDFDLLLPDDEVELQERAEALSHWCQGFLQGLGSLSGPLVCGEDGKEVLNDLYQIANLQTQGLTDEDEESYFELAEYLRVAVQLLRTEFRAPADAKRLH